MKLKDTFVSHITNGEQILVDVSSSFSGLIRSNKTAAFIVDQLKSETTLDSIVDAMFEKYDEPKEVLRLDAQALIDKLRSVGAIDEQHNI